MIPAKILLISLVLFVVGISLIGNNIHKFTTSEDENLEIEIPENYSIKLEPKITPEASSESETEEYSVETEKPKTIKNETENKTSSIVLICDPGYTLDDGKCVKLDDVNKIKPPAETQNETSQTEEGNKTGNTPNNNVTISFDEIKIYIDRIPKPLKSTVMNFLGDKEDFIRLATDILNSENASEKAQSDLLSQIENFSGIDSIKSLDPMLSKSLVLNLGPQGVSIGNGLRLVGGIVGGVGNLIVPAEVHTYDEDDYRIDKIETVWKSDEKTLNVYFKSYAAMYTYTVIAPLSIYIDVDNDGNWDIKYTVLYNSENGKAFYNIKQRNDPWINSRPLEYSLTDKKISFKLGNEITDRQRVFFWIGEPDTNLRYPKHNNLVLFTSNGKMIKNAMDYIVVLVKNLKVTNDGDAAQEGEIFLTNLMLISRPLEELDSEEARRLIEYRERGVISEDDIPKWFAYWLFKDSETTQGVTFQKTSFPLFKWVEMNDGDVIFVGRRGLALESLPALAERSDFIDEYKIVFFSTIVGDYDDWPSSIKDKPGWLIAKLIDSGVSSAGLPGTIIKGIVRLMYYGVSGENEDFQDIMEDAFNAIFSVFGSPDYIGAPSIRSTDGLPSTDTRLTASSGGAQVQYYIYHIKVPTAPMNMKVKIDKIKIKDRSDGLRGEYYFYGRVCTAIGRDGFYDGISFAWPSGKTGKCVDEKFSHGFKKVWDGDTVAKDLTIVEGNIRYRPFIYFELQGWDEDAEHIGDDDDPMGLVDDTILLDEKNFNWSVESNIPTLSFSTMKDASKTKIYYEIQIN